MAKCVSNKYSNSRAYLSIMAGLYDNLMSSSKYGEWEKLITDVIEKYNIKIGTCLDIACGTGNITKMLTEFDFKVIGVDISSDMVSVAKRKFPKQKFINADAKEFELSEKDVASVTFAVSFYDSLNYILTDSDMLNTFRNIYCNLPKGSIFLFDMNPMDHIKAAQKFRPRIFEENDLYSIFRFGGKGRFWTLNIDFFLRKGEKYKLVQEQHVERGYDRRDIVPMLKKAGFKLLEVRKEFKVYEDGKKHLSRLYFIARKK